MMQSENIESQSRIKGFLKTHILRGRGQRSGLTSVYKVILVSLVLQWSSPALSLNVAPDWLVKTTEGETISLQQELKRGQKVVMVFWASWCRYCKKLLPEVETLSQQLKGQPVTFVTFHVWQNGGENASPKNYFLTENIKLPLVMRADMIAAKYKLKTTPGIFVIENERKVIYEYQPGSTAEEVIQQLETALVNHSQ